MKVLYVGGLGYGDTARMRMSQLEALGHIVETIDTSETPKVSLATRNIGRVSWRLGWPLDFLKVNVRMIDVARQFRPEMVWVDKGTCVTKNTLQTIRHILPSVRLVHYNPDDPFGRFGKRGWRTFIDAISFYDVHFVPRRENIAEYANFGAQCVIHNIPMWGFDPNIHRPYDEANDLKAMFCADIGFLGAFETERANSLQRLAECDFSIRLTSDWPKEHWHRNFLRAPVAVRGAEYAKAIGSVKISLGFLRKANRDQHTSRSIEIPACKTFLLAERTEEHLMLFEEGKEAEFFSSHDELVDKSRYYIVNDRAREKIAQAGRERCFLSGYDYKTRMRLNLDDCLQYLNK